MVSRFLYYTINKNKIEKPICNRLQSRDTADMSGGPCLLASQPAQTTSSFSLFLFLAINFIVFNLLIISYKSIILKKKFLILHAPKEMNES